MLGLLWAVLASVASTMALGMLWYGRLFSKPWMKAMGWGDMGPEELKEKQDTAGPGYAVSMLTAAGATVLIWFLFGWMGDAPAAYAPWLKGLVLGFTGFFAFYVPGTFTATFFSEQSRTIWWIGAGYWMILAILWGLFVGIFHS